MPDNPPQYQPVPPPAAAYPPPQPGYSQPVVVQPVVVQQQPQPHPPAEPQEDAPVLIIYSHSNLFYWWPVWVLGYGIALLTSLSGKAYPIETDSVLIYPNGNLGVLFFLTIFLVILITNITVRGLASALVIVTLILFAVLLAYFGLWDTVLGWLGDLKIYLNVGAYFWFSTLLFIAWGLAFFIFDRMTYWRIKPGQITQEFIFGAAAKSYDTENLVLEKYREDLFRHWILGLGSGDIHLLPYGANREQIYIPNVLFVGHKIRIMQDMIATKPDAFGHAVLK